MQNDLENIASSEVPARGADSLKNDCWSLSSRVEWPLPPYGKQDGLLIRNSALRRVAAPEDRTNPPEKKRWD